MKRARPKIMVAPNGARRSKTDHPALPLTLEQILATACACHRAGADGLHLHIRDAQGKHTLDVQRYGETLCALAEAVPTMRVQITTEAAGVFDTAAQYACLQRLAPAWASIAGREMARDAPLAARIYACAAEQGTKVQHILYSIADLHQLRRWQQDGTVGVQPLEVLFVLGAYNPPRLGRAAHLTPLLTALPQEWRWSVCAFGAQEQACLLAAAAVAGATAADWLRVGFENNLQSPSGSPWRDNAQAVASLLSALNVSSGNPARE